MVALPICSIKNYMGLCAIVRFWMKAMSGLLAKLLWVKLSRTIGLRIGLKKLNNVHPQFTN